MNDSICGIFITIILLMSEHGKSPIAHKNGSDSKRDKMQK